MNVVVVAMESVALLGGATVKG